MKDISDVETLKRQIDKVKNFKDTEAQKDELKELFQQNKISLDELLEKTRQIAKSTDETAKFTYDGVKLEIKRFASHYYVPSIISEAEKVNFIKHIVKVESERKFLQKLQEYIGSPKDRLNEFDDWAFSKLDESLDNVVIPYVNKAKNLISNFNPDFIFWFKRGNDFSIVFIDPKGAENISGYAYKLEGYKEFFRDGEKPKVFSQNGFNVKVFVYLYHKNKNSLPNDLYPGYWIDKMDDVIDKVLAET
jgi:hypothetical protein